MFGNSPLQVSNLSFDNRNPKKREEFMSNKRQTIKSTETSTALAVQNENLPDTPQPKSPRPQFFPTLATDDPELPGLLAVQAAITTLPFGAKSEKFNTKFSEAVTRSIGPRDGLEALLALQMVATHNLAMHYLNLAAQNQTVPAIELFTNSANHLLRTFSKQVEALKTYRSKGEQRVEVEHVHVHRGGQAIVGAVSHTSQGGGDEA